MDHIDLAEMFGRQWKGARKGQVITVRDVPRTQALVAGNAQVGAIGVSVIVAVSPRGGVKQYLYVYDPRQALPTDRMLVAGIPYSEVDPIDLYEIQRAKRAGGEVVAVCARAMRKLLANFAERPDYWEHSLSTLHQWREDVSPMAYGLPGRRVRRRSKPA